MTRLLPDSGTPRRDGRPGRLLRQLSRDSLYGTRLMRKAPGFSAAAVAVIALGIAAVTAVFSLVNGIILRPLPYSEPDRLVTLWTNAPRLALARNPGPVSAADFEAWRAGSRAFEDMALVRPVATWNLVGAGEPERLVAARVSPGLFHILGVRPAVGRAFEAGEDQPGRNDVVIFSHAFWKRRFGGESGIVGSRVVLSGIPHTVVGIMPPGFDYPGPEFEAWTPLTIDPDELTRRDVPYNYLALARLRAGVGLAQAQSELDAIAAGLAAAYPRTNRDVGVLVRGMLPEMVRPVRPALNVLIGAAGCLLVIASLNLAGLLAARGASRQREFAVRLALGATRGQLTAQAVAEVAPLLLTGGAVGVMAAMWAVSVFVRAAPPSIPRVAGLSVDGSVLSFAAVALAATGALAALAPARHAWRSDVTATIRDSSRSLAGGRREARGRRLLVATQVALAVPLLFCASLLMRSFGALTRVDPGFHAQGAVAFHLAIPRSKYPSEQDVADMCSRMLDRVVAAPGIAAAALVNRLPLDGFGQIGILEPEGWTGDDRDLVSVDTRSVSAGYFDTLGIPLVAGRALSDRDTPETTAVGVVDERAARALWPGGDALGKRFRLHAPGTGWVEIVGVVGHVRNDGLDVDARAQVYWPYRQRPQDRVVLVARGSDARTMVPSIMQAIHAVDPDQPVYDVRPMQDVLARSLSQRWLSTALLSAFAAVSLALAGIGLYGVVALGVTRRSREFAIRLALGAERSNIFRLVLGEGARIAVLGAVSGVPLAVFLARALDSLLFGVTARDPAGLALPSLILLGTAILASLLPARRAAGVDPGATLKQD